MSARRFVPLIPILAALFVAGCVTSRPDRGAAEAGAAAPAGQHAPDAHRDPAPVAVAVERERRDLALAPDTQLIRIVNPHGSVGVRNVREALVGVQATVQRIGDHGEEPTIRIEQQGATALVEIGYASDATTGTDAPVDGHRKGRVDLAVFVPPAILVEVETTYGNIELRRLDNDARARSRDGRIVGAGTGFLDLASETGAVRAFPMSGKWIQPLRFATRTGPIFVDVPGYGEITLDARTKGRIDADFEVARSRDGERNVASFRNASGAQRVEIVSETGSISLQYAARPPTPM